MEFYTFLDYCMGRFRFKGLDKKYGIEADIVTHKDGSKTYVVWVYDKTKKNEEVEAIETNDESEALNSLISLAKKYQAKK